MRRLLLSGVLLASSAVPSAAADAAPGQGWVVLPLSEYRDLRSRATPPSPEPPPPPVAATFSRVDYDLRLQDDVAVGEARFTVDVLAEGWACLPLPAGLRIEEASLQGHPAPVLPAVPAPSAPRPPKAAGDGPCLLLSRPGHASLVLRLAVPVSAGPTSQLSLPSSSAPVTRATLSLGTAGVEATVSGGLLVDGEGGRLVAQGRPGEALAFSWRRRQEDHRASLPLRLRARTVETVALAEDSAQVAAEIDAEVVQGLLKQLEVALPPGLSVTRVGAVLADWDVKGDKLLVDFLEPVSGTTHVSLAGESRVAREGQVSVPIVRVPAAERETGGVAVEVLGAGEIKQARERGMEPADPEELGEALARRGSPSLLAFRHRPLAGQAERSLQVEVLRYTPKAVPVAVADEARLEVLLTEEGPALVRARWAVRNQQRSFLAVTLPEGATLWGAAVAGLPLRPGRSESGAVLVPVEKLRAGDEPAPFAVEVVYLRRAPAWDRRGRARLLLPAIDLEVARTCLEVFGPPRYELEPQPGAFRAESGTGASVVSPVLRADDAAGLPAAEPEAAAAKDAAERERQQLASSYKRTAAAGRMRGGQPVRVRLPRLGVPVTFASELTAAGQAPSLEVVYRRVEKE